MAFILYKCSFWVQLLHFLLHTAWHFLSLGSTCSPQCHFHWWQHLDLLGEEKHNLTWILGSTSSSSSSAHCESSSPLFCKGSIFKVSGGFLGTETGGPHWEQSATPRGAGQRGVSSGDPPSPTSTPGTSQAPAGWRFESGGAAESRGARLAAGGAHSVEDLHLRERQQTNCGQESMKLTVTIHGPTSGVDFQNKSTCSVAMFWCQNVGRGWRDNKIKGYTVQIILTVGQWMV